MDIETEHQVKKNRDVENKKYKVKWNMSNNDTAIREALANNPGFELLRRNQITIIPVRDNDGTGTEALIRPREGRNVAPNATA